VGFAADGFPIFGSEFYDPDLDTVRAATSSYQLKAGTRPSGAGEPGGVATYPYIIGCFKGVPHSSFEK